jgi:bifunctional DNase/RNase
VQDPDRGTRRRVASRADHSCRTYHGDLQLERAGQFITVDSRPSDAIAIALRLDAPIFATEALLALPDDEQDGGANESDDADDDASDDSFMTPTGSREDAEPNAELSADQLKEYLEQLRPEDFGKFKL